MLPSNKLSVTGPCRRAPQDAPPDTRPVEEWFGASSSTLAEGTLTI